MAHGQTPAPRRALRCRSGNLEALIHARLIHARVGAILLLLSSIGAIGCQSWKGGGLYVKQWQPAWKGEDKQATFRVGLPGSGWEALQQDGTQVAWRHTTDPAVIQVHSECEDHGDSDLEDFTDHQRIDYSSWKIVEEPTGELDAEGRPRMRKRQFYTTIAQREALRTTVEANLDGGEVMIEYVVLKKNGCLFDLTYIAVPRVFEQHAGAFEDVVEGFEFPVRGR